MPGMLPASRSLLAAVLLVTGVQAASAQVQFENVAARAGILFEHDPSKSAAKHLIEAMGAGVAVFDYDGDGLLDLYFVNGAAIRKVDGPAAIDKSDPRFWNRLYRNNGDWTFEDVTEVSGTAGRGYGMGVAVADFDADGDQDIFVTNSGPDLLLRNDGQGAFEDVTARAGVEGSGWSAGAAFLDFDRDGVLDLFVARYLDWTLATSRPCGDLQPSRRSYCHPREFGAVSHVLFRGIGGGRFEDVSEETGVAAHPGKGLGVAVNDFDGDGWTDVLVANDSFPQQLFRNAGGRRFDEVGLGTGVAYDEEGRDYAGMGVAWEDFDGDLAPDILINALGRQGYWIYRNVEGRFEPMARQSGLAGISALRSGWGMGLVDLDSDGWRDLFVAQGHVMDDIQRSDPALSHEEPLLAARNLFGQFYDVSGKAGSPFRQTFAARGAAFGDLDGDGRVDVAVNVNGGPGLVLRNASEAGSSISVSLVGEGGNPDAIGATVTVEDSDGRRQRGFRGTGGSYLSASWPVLHFGLGDGGRCARVEVSWPDGTKTAVSDPQDARIVVRKTR